MARRSLKSAHSKDQMTFSWMEPDPSAVPAAAKAFVQEVREDQTGPTHFLVSCGKHKLPTEARAADLYTSPRFKLATGLPQRLGLPFSVLSAKHGLLEPDEWIEPYDLSLSSQTKEERLSWAERVFAQLMISHPNVRRLVLLADDDYRDDLVPLLNQTELKIVEPLLRYERSRRVSFLRHAHRFLDRENAIRSLYQFFERSNDKGLPSLKEALSGSLPSQGVYFFFDPEEITQFSDQIPRLVRIGTHAVSAGSKATLRERLRAHLGTANGYGNHRASVFRLHVGEALIRRDDLRDRFPHWGKGQNVEKSVADAERELERQVSAYISRLQLCCIDVADIASKHSARSKIERLSIALFTERLVPVEAPSSDWLGLHSAHEEIVRTGIWNVRDVGTRSDFSIVDLISNRAP